MKSCTGQMQGGNKSGKPKQALFCIQVLSELTQPSRSVERVAHMFLFLIFCTEPPHSLRTPLCTLRSVVSLFPVFQCFYHADMGTLIEEGLPGDNIVQMGIQIQCLFVPGSDMQSDFGIAVLACLLLRTVQQARADPLAAPISEHSERIDIPFIVLGLPFEPASNGGVEPCLISPP